jgi:putative heme-binding domain-containing protein
MKSSGTARALTFILAFVGLSAILEPVQAQRGGGVQWIWLNEGDPLKKAPAEACYFRRAFDVGRVVDEATIDITADKSFTLFVNGTEIGKGDNPKRVYHFDVKKYVLAGKNSVAIEAIGSGGPSGLLVRLMYVPNGQSVVGIPSDASWKVTKMKEAGWEKTEFDDGKWTAAKVLGAYGKTGPWKGQVWDAGGDDRFSVPPGFRVEQALKTPSPELLKELIGDINKNPTHLSLVNMCFDAKGRLLMSQENGPVLVCTEPDKDGVYQSAKRYCDLVKNCHGMCWVNDALLLVGNGPKGTGLYRCKDTKGADKIDSAELLMSFRGGMGEHGPHAIIHGPDNWLYVVIGNHAGANVPNLADNSPLRRWPTGAPGPDQGKPNTTEDVLLPRLNDSNGHAANILAPGGTIWRMDTEGKNISLFSAGYRNQFDAAINSLGEMFTFDSDMEWDEGLPWYRHVRVCHVTPGSDFVWRTGAANTPNYYLDSLPPTYETGRGSPVGLEFYEHNVFPERYRGAYFMADWSLGLIWVVFLEKTGASYKARVERFCQGAPMNVTDLNVGPDGAMYFVMGGRGSQGGVYRIVYPAGIKQIKRITSDPDGDIPQPQPLAAWNRARVSNYFLKNKEPDKKKSFENTYRLLTVGRIKGGDDFNKANAVRNQIQVLNLMQMHGSPPDADFLLKHNSSVGEKDAPSPPVQDKDPLLRAHAVYLLGVNGYKEGEAALLKALKDEDKLVQRRACEALIRAGFEPPLDAIWPLLGDSDPFLRTAARLGLQRIDPAKWADRLWKEEKDLIVLEGILALCKENKAAPYADAIYGRLVKMKLGEPESTLNHVRTYQLALIHAPSKSTAAQDIAKAYFELFPQKDWRINRELAIALAHCRKEGILERPVHAALLKDLLANKDDRQQQIHYFYCLRFLHEGWTSAEKEQLIAWFDTAKTWSAPGYSFKGFLDNIFRDANPIFTAEDRVNVLAKADQYPRAAGVLLKLAPPKDVPPPKVLIELYDKVASTKAGPSSNDLKAFIIDGLAQSSAPEAQATLRKIADKEPNLREAVARALARNPSPENFPYLLAGLQSGNQLVLVDVIDALAKVSAKPKAEEAAPFRALLVASEKVNPKQRWKVAELLRAWTNRNFGAEKQDFKTELTAFSKWFAQTFPKEPPLPNLTVGKPSESKYKLEDLVAYLEKDPVGSKGDPAKGRMVFEKGQCIKCHKYGSVGQGIGPDLTMLSKRFKRRDIADKMLFPSKTISDQFRGTVIITTKGAQISGLAAPQGNVVTVLQSDGTTVTLQKNEIEQQIASLVSVMPEKLLDQLTLPEIADLFAFLESEPPK